MRARLGTQCRLGARTVGRLPLARPRAGTRPEITRILHRGGTTPGRATAVMSWFSRTKVDPRVLFAVKGPEEHGSCLGTIEYDVKVTGDITDEQLQTIETLCKHSPVYGMMAETIPCRANVTRV